uniref:Uncharacterized protein n=1 Tax=Setaria viridis TaxID=4556 RepID=A0A4U6TAJ3_SETVI|nr:hypothetical protein SEVIR_8G011400v2 [Setaria viridis]
MARSVAPGPAADELVRLVRTLPALLKRTSLDFAVCAPSKGGDRPGTAVLLPNSARMCMQVTCSTFNITH